MFDNVVTVANKDLLNLNTRLLVGSRLRSENYDLSADELQFLASPENDIQISDHGLCLFSFGFGRETEWSDLDERYEFLLIARDLATQKDQTWMTTMCGLPAAVSADLVTSTKSDLRGLARCSTRWRFRFPSQIFKLAGQKNTDYQITAARLILAGIAS